VITFPCNLPQGWLIDPVDASGATVIAAKPSGRLGMSCRRCREHNNYAEPNTPDGDGVVNTFTCWSCRQNRFR
jgi:hypothetical protein